MCFITTRQARAKIATKNIICYKKEHSFNKRTGIFHSYYQSRFIYRIDVKQPVIHLKKEIDRCESRDYREINAGYHSYNKKVYTVFVLGKFIIPKGTRYFENKERGEYVSETIIFKGIIK
jgi:hypothetical protein